MYKRVLLDVRNEEHILRSYPEIELRDYYEIFTMVLEDINLNNDPMRTSASISLSNIISIITNRNRFMDVCNKVKYSIMEKLKIHQIGKNYYCETYSKHYLILQHLSD